MEDPESDNEYDGLLQLFETKDQVEEGNVEDISALIERLVKDIDEPDNNEYANEMRVTDDGIVLSTSMFIILLCLSVFAGLFIGKGKLTLDIASFVLFAYMNQSHYITNILLDASPLIFWFSNNGGQRRDMLFILNSVYAE